MKKKIASVARKNSKRNLKPKKYQSVSKALGLERLEKSTPKTCRDRAAEIEKKIKAGKIPKAMTEKAHLWVQKYRQRAKSLAK